MHRSTETGSGSLALGRPAVVGQVDYRQALVINWTHDCVSIMIVFTQFNSTEETKEVRRTKEINKGRDEWGKTSVFR